MGNRWPLPRGCSARRPASSYLRRPIPKSGRHAGNGGRGDLSRRRISTRPACIARHWPAHGYRYIHSGDEPDMIAGVATEALEMLEDQPALDVILVPIGGGSGAAGTALVARAIDPRIRVIGVQSESAGSLSIVAPAATGRVSQPYVRRGAGHGRRLRPAAGHAAGNASGIRSCHRRANPHGHRVDDRTRPYAGRGSRRGPPGRGLSIAARIGWPERGLVCSGGNISLEHLKQAPRRSRDNVLLACRSAPQLSACSTKHNRGNATRHVELSNGHTHNRC